MDYQNEEWKQREFAERFGAALSTWRFEVDSYWTRTSYFALFETAALGASWYIFKDYQRTSLFASILGVLLTTLWFWNNARMHEYVEEWWIRTGDIEREFNVSSDRKLVDGFDLRRKTHHIIPYNWLDKVFIPTLFMLAWFWLLAWSAARLFCLQH